MDSLVNLIRVLIRLDPGSLLAAVGLYYVLLSLYSMNLIGVWYHGVSLDIFTNVRKV